MYHLTTQGCRKCNEAIPGCNSCYVTKEANASQVLLADSYLNHTGEHLMCKSCPKQTYLKQKSVTGDDLSICMSCSSKFSGCLDCGTKGQYCERCKFGYIQEGTGSSTKCIPCSKYMDGCSDCRSSTECLECKSGYELFFGACSRSWF